MFTLYRQTSWCQNLFYFKAWSPIWAQLCFVVCFVFYCMSFLIFCFLKRKKNLPTFVWQDVCRDSPSDDRLVFWWQWGKWCMFLDHNGASAFKGDALTLQRRHTNGEGKPGACGIPHGTLKASELHCGFFYKQEVLGLRLESHSSPMRPVTATATDYTAEWVNHLLFSIRIFAITGHINNNHYYHEPITSWL